MTFSPLTLDFCYSPVTKEDNLKLRDSQQFWRLHSTEWGCDRGAENTSGASLRNAVCLLYGYKSTNTDAAAAAADGEATAADYFDRCTVYVLYWYKSTKY